MNPNPLLITDQFLSPFLTFLAFSWWFWAFLFLSWLAVAAWLFYRQELFKESINWVLLELKMPREIRKSPRAMEQILHSIHALRNEPADVREKWWDGEVTRWYSLEIASFGGEVHFYIRCYAKQKNLIMGALLSYYPDIEIEEVDDYVNRFPANTREMYNQGYDLWGAEMLLRRESCYPIRTYVEFEAVEETKEYDPISALVEFLATVKREEIVAVQHLITPLPADWGDKWQKLLEQLKLGREAKKSKPKTSVSFPGPAGIGPLPHFEVVPAERAETTTAVFSRFMRTPGETEVLKAVENNLSKPAFKTQIRFIYFSPRSMYSDTFPRRGLLGTFNQYASASLNSLAINYKVSPRIKVWVWPHIFPGVRAEYRKQRLLYAYKKREVALESFIGKFLTSYIFNWNFESKPFEMSVECLATLFHPPTYLVLTAPHVIRTPSRKMGPPPGIAVFGGEEEIEKFK